VTDVMEGGRENGSNRPLLVAAILGLAIVASCAVLGNSLVQVFRIKHADRVIVVTGSTKRRITSDRIVWKATVAGHAPELAAGYRELATNVPKMLEFIKSRGVDPNIIVTSSVRIQEIHPRDKEGNPIEQTIAAYSVEQDVSIESDDVAKITAVSRDVTQLIEQGIHIQSDAPLYLYTKLADLKIQMLADAANDARVRADQIASKTGAKIARLGSAKMGVMQVNAANQSEVSGSGVNDTSSLEKDVLAIVTATFGID
jgi:hypothetical protein